MKPAGIILTYMRWLSKWFLFNLVLFLWQIVFLVVGTIYGKIKWPKQWLPIQVTSIVGIMATVTGIISSSIAGWWLLSSIHFILFILFIATYRGIDWCKVWRAAQVCHVRLYLKEMTSNTWQYISFGYPVAKLDYWRPDMIDGKRFEYQDPTFDPSPEFITAMIEYAYAQEGKAYDVPQLASYCVNLAIWIVRPKYWGLEICKWFNRPGGHESCSSGVAACLRWAEFTTEFQYGRILRKNVVEMGFLSKIFFEWFDTAMVPPCLFKIDKNWRGNEKRKIKET